MPPPTVVSCVEPLPCACPWQVLPICLDALAMRSSSRSMCAPTHTRRVLGTSTNLSRRRRVWAKVAASQSSRWTWVVACVARGSIYSQAGCRLKIVSRAVLPTRLRHDVPTIICIPTERMCRLGPSTAPTIALSQIIGESRRLANASGWKGGVCVVCCGLVPHFKRLCVLCGSDSNSQFAVKPRATAGTRGRWRWGRWRWPVGSQAFHSCVFIVPTIVEPPPGKAAGTQVRFRAGAADVVHPNLPASLPKPGVTAMNDRTCKPELAADDLCVVQTPLIVAHGAPLPVVVDLDPTVACSCGVLAVAWLSIHQPNRGWGCGWGRAR